MELIDDLFDKLSLCLATQTTQCSSEGVESDQPKPTELTPNSPP